MSNYHDQPGPPPANSWGHGSGDHRGWGSRGTPPESMRVSDAERAEVTSALCRHFGDGRLDEAELNDRLAVAAASKTRADLAPLLADLPPFDVQPPAPRPPRPRVPGLAWILLAVLVVASATWSFGAHALHPPVPWLPLLLVAWLVLRRRRGRGRHRDHLRP